MVQNKLAGHLKGISCSEVREKATGPAPPFILDTRGPHEFEEMRLGIGETLIPLGALRDRLNELPEDRDTEIICFCKISLRGYEAALVLPQELGDFGVLIHGGWSRRRALVYNLLSGLTFPAGGLAVLA